MKYLRITRLLLLGMFALVTLPVTASASAAWISVLPDPHYSEIRITGPSVNVPVEIWISGLSNPPSTVLGAWQFDLTYDPSIFQYNGTAFGSALGDPALGESIVFDSSVPGIVSLGEVSLLESDPGSCVFCVGPYLSDLQSNFRLATINLLSLTNPGFIGVSDTFLNLQNITLSDATGNDLVSGTGPSAFITLVPEPSMLVLLLVGLCWFSAIRPVSCGLEHGLRHLKSSSKRVLALLPGLILSSFLLVYGNAQAATINVDPGDVNGLRNAILAANNNSDPNNTIVLPMGTWLVTSRWTGAYEAPDTAFPTINKTVTIKGVGKGATIIARSPGAPKFRFFWSDFSSSISERVTISNLTLSNGDVRSNGNGGALFFSGLALLDLNNVEFLNNHAASGGAIYHTGHDIQLDGVTINGNSASGEGGGAFFGPGEFKQIARTAIINNQAQSAGGIYVDAWGLASVTDSSITGNQAITGNGGGIINANAGNGQLTIQRTEISNNSAKGIGGGMLSATNQISLQSTTLTGNFAEGNGSALWIFGFLEGPSPTLSSVTITSNKVSSTGYALATSESPPYGGITVSNSIIANTISQAGDVVSRNCEPTKVSSLGHNIDSDGSCNFSGVGDRSFIPAKDVIDLIPRNNGGLTLTHALVRGGPAVDKGSSCGNTDQRGVKQPQDGDNNGTAVCDIGAYELQPATLALRAIADSYVRTDVDARRNDNYGMQEYLLAGTGRGGDGKPYGAPDQMRALVRFDTSMLPKLGLTGATLATWLHSYDNGATSSAYIIDAHRIQSSWTEGNGFEGIHPPAAPANLTNPDAASGVAWAGVGANTDPYAINNTTQPPYESNILSSLRIDQAVNVTGDRLQWNITDVTKQWLETPLTNHGIMLTDVTSDRLFRGVRMGSRDGKALAVPGAVDGPMLILSWTVGTQLGDLTGDNCIDQNDLKVLLAVVRGQALAGAELRVDLNNDGKVNITDTRKLVTLFSKYGGASCQ